MAASTRAARRSNVEYIVRYLAFILGCSIVAMTSGGAVAHENVALGVFVIDLRTKDAVLVTPFGSRETGLGIFKTAQPSWRAAP